MFQCRPGPTPTAKKHKNHEMSTEKTGKYPSSSLPASPSSSSSCPASPASSVNGGSRASNRLRWCRGRWWSMFDLFENNEERVGIWKWFCKNYHLVFGFCFLKKNIEFLNFLPPIFALFNVLNFIINCSHVCTIFSCGHFFGHFPTS